MHSCLVSFRGAINSQCYVPDATMTVHLRRFQLIEEAIQQHALQNGAVAFLEDLSGAQRQPEDAPAEAPADVDAPADTLEEELAELHGPCDRFSAPPAPAPAAHDDPIHGANQSHDRADDRLSTAGVYGYWGCEDVLEEVSGPPAEEDKEPTSLDAEPCGDAPPAGKPLLSLTLCACHRPHCLTLPH